MNEPVIHPVDDDMAFRHVEGVGYVRPGVVKAQVMRNLVGLGVIPGRRQRRALGRMARRNAPAVPAGGPPLGRPPLSERETTDRVAAVLLEEWDRYHRDFPAVTLAKFLDDKAAAEVLSAWRAGKPIDRDTVRRGIGKLWEDAQRRQRRKR